MGPYTDKPKSLFCSVFSRSCRTTSRGSGNSRSGCNRTCSLHHRLDGRYNPSSEGGHLAVAILFRCNSIGGVDFVVLREII